MNSNATNAGTLSSNWLLVPIKTRVTHALHAETTIPADKCPPFPATLPKPSGAQPDCPPPAPLLRVDSPELDFHGRAPCFFLLVRSLETYRPASGFGRNFSLSFDKLMKGNHVMSIGWILLIIVAWIVLQAYVLPKFGIST